jgi:hypothetical protein
VAFQRVVEEDPRLQAWRALLLSSLENEHLVTVERKN